MSNDMIMCYEGTVYEKGFGHIAKVVMTDKTISVTAKAIYAYLCSYCFGSISNEKVAFPSVKTQCDDLGIKSEKTYYTHRKQLEDAGYIRIETIRAEKGKFKKNIYHLPAVIQPKEKDPSGKNYRTVKNTGNPSGKNYRTVKNTGRIKHDLNTNTIQDKYNTRDVEFETVSEEWKNTFGQALKKNDYKKIVKDHSLKFVLTTIRSIHKADVADEIAHPVRYVLGCLKNGGYKVKSTVPKRDKGTKLPRCVQDQLERENNEQFETKTIVTEEDLNRVKGKWVSLNEKTKAKCNQQLSL